MMSHTFQGTMVVLYHHYNKHNNNWLVIGYSSDRSELSMKAKVATVNAAPVQPCRHTWRTCG